MPKRAIERGAMWVKECTEPGLHFVGGVAGLALQVSESGARSWIVRIAVGSKRRDMGLGAYPDVTLAGARDAARMAREKLRSGVDPVEERRAAQSAMRSAAAAALTFEQCATRYMAAHESGWKSAKHADQWRNTLRQYANPVMGSLLVRDVGLSQVMAVLEPIWTTKTETASRLRGRIELVLDWAAARGYRSKENPARWRGHLDKLLAKPSKVAQVEHHRAVSLADAGEFMQRLREQQGIGARALEFAILTAARSGEVRGACWAEIDLSAATWTLAAERMKAGRPHRVPLSAAAIKLLQSLKAEATGDEVFPAPRGGKLSDMTLAAVLRRMGVDAVPHGFRSTFRDWAAERTAYPNELAEMALAHVVGDKTEAAYRRGDMFERRRRMMDDWAEFLSRPTPTANIVSMRAQVA